MRWALRRQFLYALSIFLVIAVVLLGVWFQFFYHAPTCFDGAQNGDELGIDCGGSCRKLCTSPMVSALWARAVEIGPGVYHAVALVQNPETDAGTMALPYKFSLYDANNILVAERTGTMELAPSEVAPLFEPNIVTGSRVPAHTFVEFGQAVWEKMDPLQNPIHVVSQSLDSQNLRLTARIENTTPLSVSNITVTALLYDTDGTLVNASRTIVPTLPAQGQTDTVFTWQMPFTASVVRVDIVPRVQ